MALRASSSCTQAVTSRLPSTKTTSTDPKSSSSGNANHPYGLVPLPAKPSFDAGSGSLRRTKSRKPVSKANASTRDASAVELHSSLESAVTQTFSKVGEEIASTSGEIMDAVDSVIDDAGPMRRTTGRTNSRTSRRRALVMCLALGMVRPCASNVASNLQQSSNNNDLRRTMSETIRSTTASASLQMPSNLMSQVSLATTLKQPNLLGIPEDLQKLTTLQ